MLVQNEELALVFGGLRLFSHHLKCRALVSTYKSNYNSEKSLKIELSSNASH